MKKQLILFIYLILPLYIHAQNLSKDNCNITYITMENGLLHNYIDDIYEDKRGFVWVSTGSGLSRYDGYTFINYNMGTSPIRLKGNFVHKICEDRFNRLWIASDGGLDVLSLDNLKLVNLFEDEIPTQIPFLKNPIINILTDKNGDIWLVSRNIYKINIGGDGQIKNILKLPENLQSMRFIAMEDVDSDGDIWAGFHDNVYKLYQAKNNELKAVPVSENLKFGRNSLIIKFLPNENDVWIGTERGLYRYFRNENDVKRYGYDESNSFSLSQNFITDLVLTKNNQLIVGTLKGLNIYNPLTDGFERIMASNLKGGEGLNSNFINCMYYNGNALWCGTETGGINKLNPKKLSIKNYTHDSDMSKSLSQNPVNVILEDKDKNLWVGTVEGGLNLKQEGQENFVHFTQSSSTQLSHNSVSALSVDNLDRLWVGTWGYGISVIDRKNPSKRSLMNINSNVFPGFLLDLVGGLFYDSINKGMWIGSNQGLYFYDLEHNKLVVPASEEIFRNILGVIGMTSDDKGYLWVGSQEGVYAINLNSNKNNQFDYSHYRYKLDDPHSQLVERITSLYLDSDNILWLGSDGFGFYKRIVNNDGSLSFESYTSSNGLANNNVKGILEDESGNLWISTNQGLSCFDKKNNGFINYYKEDGIDSNQFYWNAYCKTESGLLYFGTLNGLIAINPSTVKPETVNYKVTLTDFYVDDEKVYPGNIINRDISQTNKISLHEKNKSFTLNFSALNYNTTNNYIYAYRLLGYDDKWIELPKNIHSASYMNLSPGNYTFQVKYVPKSGIEQGATTNLQIRIKPFFYKTVWFAILIAVLAITTFLLWYYRRVKIYEEQQKYLQQTVDERTRELEYQKGILIEQKNELSQQNLMLSRQNEKITQQKNQLINMSRKVQKMNVDRLEFFTNISHEFRTPITLIMGPVERALRLSTNPYVIEQLNFADRNSKYLLSLINQLMDFQKIESKKIDVSYVKNNFLNFMETILSSFDSQASDRNITIRRRFSLIKPVLFYDDEAIHKIMINLLSNAIKYTPNGGEITIYIKSLIDKQTDKEKIYISVKDSGAGIPEEDLDKIFRRFYQSRNHLRFPVHGQSGTGIGLYLCKQIVQLLGGVITVKNNKGAGCSFRTILPLHRNNPHSDEVISKNADNEVPQPVVQSGDHLDEWKKGRLTFLVVEDNRDMGNYICSVLSTDYNTLEAKNGIEALHILEKHNIDFIISDLMMPEMDGIELSKKVKEKFSTSHIPFLMLTAKTSEAARLESYRVGVDSYIVKPFDEEILLTRIRNILQTRESYQQQFSKNMNTDVFGMTEESNDRKFMNNVLEVMKKNYQNPYFEVSDFIEAMGVSKSLLNKKLNALSGKSSGQFIRIYRLNIAYSLILENKKTRNKNISDIAYDVGFNDPKYFTRCFSKQFNVTPSGLMGE